MKWLIATLFMAVFVANIDQRVALADTAEKTPDPQEISKLIETIAIPESPAFSVLGITADKVVRPGNVRALALAMIQGVDEHGNVQNGLALDFTPYLLLYGDELALADYRKSRLAQFLSHVQLSLGTAKGQDVNDESMRFAAGLRARIFDLGDPRMDTDFDSCIKRVHDRVFDPGPIPPASTAEEIAQKIKENERLLEVGAKSCRNKHAEKSLGKPALDVGVSPLWVSEDGQSKNLRGRGVAAWSAYKMGFGRWLGIANVQYKTKDVEPDPAQPRDFLEGRSTASGLKVRYGSASSAILVQGVYTTYSPDGKPKQETSLYSLGGEIKLADSLWLEVAAGGTRNKQGDETTFITSQFRWGLSESAMLGKK